MGKGIITVHTAPSSSALSFSNFNNRILGENNILMPNAAFILVFVVGIFSHWPAIISDSIMWDDWIVLAWMTQSRFDWVFQFCHNYGVTPYFLVFSPFVYFFYDVSSSILTSKILYLFGVTLNAIIIMLISKKISHGNLIFATFAGVTAVCFPALSGEGFHLSLLMYYFFIPLFLLGIFLFIVIASCKKLALLIRVFALSVLFLSFSLNSLLVMFYALVPAVFYASLQDQNQNLRSLFINAKGFLVRHLDFLVLPLVFWLVKEAYMPRLGLYARYNKIHFDWSGILSGYARLIPDILQTTFFVPFSIPFVSWVVGLAFIIVMFSAKPILARFDGNADASKRHYMILLGFGFIALCGAALPYYMVGRRSFQAFGFMSRDNILFSLPISWITAALFCMFLKPQASLQRDQSGGLSFLRQRIILSVFAALIVSQSLSNWRNHLDWQAHYAYYHSVINKISQDPLVRQATVIQVVNQLPGERTLQAYRYPTSIWTEIISEAFQKTDRVAIPFSPANGCFFTRDELIQYVRDTEVDFMFHGVNLEGPQIRLTINATSNSRSPIRLALAYWKARFFSPADLPNLLHSLTLVKSEKIGRE